MKFKSFLLAALMLMALVACQSDTREKTENDSAQVNTKQETPEKMIEHLAGEWQLERPSQGNAGEGDKSVERLTLTEEARYIVHSGNQKTDSGAFRMNEQLKNLYLESEADERPREYEVEVKGDVMTLKPKEPGAAGQQNESYTYRRVGKPSISPDKRGE